MKRITLGILAFLISFSAFSQNKEMNKFFNNLEESSDYAVVKVNKEMFQLLAAMNAEGDSPELKELVRDLNEITILVDEEGKADDYSAFQSLVSKNKLTEYMSMKDDENTVNLYSGGSAENGKLDGIVLSVKSLTETVFIHVDGKVDLAALGKVMRDLDMDIDGMEYLKKVDKK